MQGFKHRGFPLEMFQEEDAWNPREWSNVSLMAVNGLRGWTLKNEEGAEFDAALDFLDPQHDEDEEPTDTRILCARAFTLYDERGGGAGFTERDPDEARDRANIVFYITQANALIEYPNATSDEDRMRWAHGILKAEFETFRAYMAGEVYGWQIKDPAGNHIGSLSSVYYGYNTNEFWEQSEWASTPEKSTAQQFAEWCNEWCNENPAEHLAALLTRQERDDDDEEKIWFYDNCWPVTVDQVNGQAVNIHYVQAGEFYSEIPPYPNPARMVVPPQNLTTEAHRDLIKRLESQIVPFSKA